MKTTLTHQGKIIPLNKSNVDTDAIIPKQFLTEIKKTGFGKYLFFNWRFLNGDVNVPNPKFILNNVNYKNSTILLTRENFGCGSSREHAVWALIDYGFKAIIAPSFADIFYNNSISNQLLLIPLKFKIIENLFTLIKKNKNIIGKIFLEEKKISIQEKEFDFKINNFHQFCLLNGFDTIDSTMKWKEKIEKYEKNIFSFFNSR
ncbi:3-isopropylmalate dehydratase small subunit (plasmid) [Buchnera aphidicola (Mindarus keteleerifoliae)]|uniref:3-isopropylmalate dehydratase small subunit n=1 Tax=Buchnera aphidicola TaxID=9 RepID=UPI0031B69D91